MAPESLRDQLMRLTFRECTAFDLGQTFEHVRQMVRFDVESVSGEG